ncbi:thioesterase domain-containing protein [Streptomyces mesophilus]|uniref:thioesterase domain-containing protein n=1 Tax=Streptomyces mesophilus TaxID=1775132 RepID=UPI0033277F71
MDRRQVLAAGAVGMATAALGSGTAAAGQSGGVHGEMAAGLGAMADALGAAPTVVDRGIGWTRTRFLIEDDGVPYAVDVVADTAQRPRSLAYLLPGGGLNFTANFFTPRERNLAHHLRRLGHLVIGITPREDLATAADIGAGWGLAAHRVDARRVIDAVDAALRLPYQLIGHSAGAALALDLAGRGDGRRLERVVLLDTTGPYEGEPAVRAGQARDAFQSLIDQGSYANDPGLEGLLARALSDPDGASPVPRPVDPTTRFTNAGLAHYALIRTNTLPGPANWIYRQGHAAGTYTFGASPAEDRFTLAHSPLPVWGEATGDLGSGLVPHALLRDLCAIWAGDDATYRIAWDRIRAEVVWINMELGRGDHPLGAHLIRRNGNRHVTFQVVPGYGHGDPVWGEQSDIEVWPLLTPK